MDKKDYILRNLITVLGSATWVWFLVWLYEVAFNE